MTPTDAQSTPDSLLAADPVQAFLLACLRSRRQAEALERVRALSRTPGFDWAAVDRAAREELLAPLLFHTLQGRDVLPGGLEGAWRGLYAGSLQRNLLLMRELDTVLRSLAGAGVTPILLKGAALVRAVYDDAGLRPMNDLDLLLREGDVPAALRQLAGLGYATDEPFSYFGEVAAHKQGALTADIDLHWNLIGLPHYLARVPAGWAWQTARPADAGGAPARVLGPEAQILHLCAHLALQHRNQPLRLLWLHDVAEALHFHREELDWGDLLERAHAYDLVLPLQQVLPLVAGALGAPVPAAAAESLAGLQSSTQERKLYRWLTAAPWSGIESSWVSLAGLPGWGARLRYLAANIFPPVEYVRRRYRIRHPALLPLGYAQRWLEGVAGSFTLAANRVRACAGVCGGARAHPHTRARR
jgi:hypothetical protein